MGKDRLRQLYRFLGEGNVPAAVKYGDSLIAELEEEIAATKKVIGLVNNVLAPHRGTIPEDGLTPSERGERVRQAALTLANKGYEVITTTDVIAYLRDEEGITLDVKRPASVIATVLAKMKEEFDKDGTAPGRFRPKSRGIGGSQHQQ
jgi:hypothetical protein